MYNLTPRMLQKLRSSLTEYHGLFRGGRCDSWQLEELIVNSIMSDTSAQHHVLWTEKGHDDKADLRVRVGKREHALQIKSGKIVNCKTVGEDVLEISGHRLGRFEEDLDDISNYLNARRADYLCVPYRPENNKDGKFHKYTVAYIPSSVLAGVKPEAWRKKGKSSLYQIGEEQVAYTLQPKMSWQIWWRVPTKLVQLGEWWTI